MSTNAVGLRPNWLSSSTHAPSSANATNIVFSRPSRSETQPKNGRLTPLRIRSRDSAKVSAGSVSPMRRTGESAMPKSFAIGVSREPAPVGKPFERVAHARAVYRSGADAADDGTRVQHRQRVRKRIDHPRRGDEHAGDDADELRPETVDEISLERDEPRLRQNEDGERHLNGRPPPVVPVVDRIDEERPTVLEVGDHRHADDAEDQLPPAPECGGARVVYRSGGGELRHRR